MRSHRDWPLLQIWSRQRHLAPWVKAAHLRVARLEPVVIKNLPAAVLDLRFVQGESGVCVPCCIVDLAALQVRTHDAIVWPYTVAHACKDEDLYEIESALLPWLRAVSAGTGIGSEVIRRFGEGDQMFEAARYARFLGAIPYAEITSELAAAHYAARFTPGKQVLTAGTLPNVAALLAPSAARTAIDGVESAELAVLTGWFGCEFLQSFAPTNPANLKIISGDVQMEHQATAKDARIIDVNGAMTGASIPTAPAHALDDLVRLSERGGRVMTTRTAPLSTQCHSNMPDIPIAEGGSGGRILMLLREDALRAPGADSDDAYALRALLTAEGFSVDVCVRPDLFDPSQYDVVHGFGLLSATAMLPLFERAERAGVPTVLTACFEDAAAGGWWGARASRSLLDLAADEEASERVLGMLASRLVNVDDLNATDRFDNGEESARVALLRIADLVIAHSEAEQLAIADYSGRTELVAQSLPLVYREHPFKPAAHLVPDHHYMFVHAPVEARHNVGLVLYAASALDIPCIFAGPILDRRLYRHIAARISTNIVMIPECSGAELAAIGEQASVYLDAAWVGDGSARILKSILHGVVPVVSDRRPLDAALEEHVVRVDPASIESLRNGMSNAWQRAGTALSLHASRTLASIYDPSDVMKATVSAYVVANERRNSLVAR